MATALCSMTGPGPEARPRRICRLQRFPGQRRCGLGSGAGEGSLPRPKRSCCRTTSTTAAVASPVTTSATRSTRPRSPSSRARTECSSSWRPAPGRPTLPSRSSRTIEADDGRTSAICEGHRRQAAHRYVVRDLPLALPGHSRPGGPAETVPDLLARFLRPHRGR
jgi:hypothetical protein